MVSVRRLGGGSGLTTGPEGGAKVPKVREVGSCEVKACISTTATTSLRLLAVILVRNGVAGLMRLLTASKVRESLKVIAQVPSCRGRPH